MRERKLFGFSADCGRMGILDGLFIATQEQVDEIIGKDVYFGEVLGKHSDIEITMNEDDFAEITDDQDLINQLEKLFKSTTLCGYNPLNYYEE